jgi:hypothetical protein
LEKLVLEKIVGSFTDIRKIEIWENYTSGGGVSNGCLKWQLLSVKRVALKRLGKISISDIGGEGLLFCCGSGLAGIASRWGRRHYENWMRADGFSNCLGLQL